MVRISTDKLRASNSGMQVSLQCINKTVFQWKTDHPSVCISLRSCDLDLDLDPVTLILELALDVLKLYLRTKN